MVANRVNSVSPNLDKREIVNIDCVSTLIDNIACMKRQLHGQLKGVSIFYRGHANKRWKLEPAIYREDGILINHEHEMAFELMRNCPYDFQKCKTPFEKLARMQHYGLPTRLIDITTNPLVALYFAALQDEGADGEILVFFVKNECIHNYDSAELHQLAGISFSSPESIRTVPKEMVETLPRTELQQYVFEETVHLEKPYQLSDSESNYNLDAVVCVLPKLDNPRIVRQQGVFFLFGVQNGDKKLLSELDVQCVRFTVNAKNKAGIRNELDQLSINQKFCFPEIDKVASYIKEKYTAE